MVMEKNGEPLVLELADGHRLEGLTWGPEDGDTVVLGLHGWLDNAATFAGLGPLLAPANGRVRFVALDFPGHGHSDHKPPYTAYHFIDWVGDIVEAVDLLGWKTFALVGHSMGANVGVLLAGSFTDRVERLVLLDGLGPLTTPPKASPSRLRMAVEQERRQREKSVRVYPSVEAAAQRRVDLTGIDFAAALTLVKRGVEKTPEGVRFRHDPRLMGHSRLRLTEEHVDAFLKRITCPTWLMLATEGLIVKMGDMMETRLKSLECVVENVEGGHHVHLEYPNRVADLVAHALGIS